MSHVLIIDDEPSICWSFEQALADDGHRVTTLATAESALRSIEKSPPDLVLLDVRLPGMDGLTALGLLRSRLAETPVIIMTAFGNLPTAVRAIKEGAFEYLTKPFNLDEAVELVRRALQSRATAQDAESELASQPVGSLVGQSPAMQAIFRQIALLSGHDVPVLISGESGTGKEMVALAIHQHSRRASGPFVPICVPALPASLVESELFGHRSGAFTGAAANRAGLLTEASGGTAFFDEIGEIQPATQVKLLRVLETKLVTPVGSNESRQADFRLIAATNRHLEELIGTGEFREDLFHRLNVFHIQIPPLRDRREDILPLAEHFLSLASGERRTLSDAARAELLARPWYGNVRELRNAMERAAIVARTRTIEPGDLPPATARLGEPDSPGPALTQAVTDWLAARVREGNTLSDVSDVYERLLEAVELPLFKQVLEAVGGNRQEAARVLGLHRQTLRERLRKHGLE
jgi:DNA-binding NtrC family response regulator